MSLDINLLAFTLQCLMTITFWGLSGKFDGPSAVTYRMQLKNDIMVRYDSNNITMLTFSKSDSGVIEMLKPSHGILTTYNCDVRAFFIVIITLTTIQVAFTYFKTPDSKHRIEKICLESAYDQETIQQHFTWNLCYWLIFGLQTTMYILVLCSPMSIYTLPFMGLVFTIFMMLICEPGNEERTMDHFCMLVIALSYVAFFTHVRGDVSPAVFFVISKVVLDGFTWRLHSNEETFMGRIVNGRIVMNAAYTALFIVIYLTWSYT